MSSKPPEYNAEYNKKAKEAKLATFGEKLTDLQRNYMRTVPKKFEFSQMEALSGEAGYAGAVKAKCQECCGFEDTEERIRSCKIYKCPLNQYRPYRGSPDASSS